MTWWWLWDGFILFSLSLSTLEALRKKSAVQAAFGVCCCWLAFLRALSSYGVL